MSNDSTLYILVILLVVAFILLVSIPGKRYVPYNKSQMYATYEPLSSIEAIEGNREKNENKEDAEVMNTNVNDMKENFEPVIDVPRTVHYGPFRDSEIIDKFSQVTTNGMDGVNGCVSSGLSNAGGYICLSPDLIKMLKTRGGNAAGGECLSKCSSSK